MKYHKLFTAISLLALSPLAFSQNINTTHQPHTTGKFVVSTKKYLNPTVRKVKKIKEPTFKLDSDSLFKNVINFSMKYHYKLLWKVTNPSNNEIADFKVMPGQVLQAKTSLGLLKEMTMSYPVNVEVWQANHVIRITAIQA